VKFTLSWLRTPSEPTPQPIKFCRNLTRVCLELEGVRQSWRRPSRLSSGACDEALPHPNSDRLRACTVDTCDGIFSVRVWRAERATGMKAVFRRAGQFHPRPSTAR